MGGRRSKPLQDLEWFDCDVMFLTSESTFLQIKSRFAYMRNAMLKESSVYRAVLHFPAAETRPYSTTVYWSCEYGKCNQYASRFAFALRKLLIIGMLLRILI